MNGLLEYSFEDSKIFILALINFKVFPLGLKILTHFLATLPYETFFLCVLFL